jgi:hypothetical protein
MRDLHAAVPEVRRDRGDELLPDHALVDDLHAESGGPR